MNTMKKPDVFERIVIYGVLVFGLWQLICTFSVFIGLTFNQLKIAGIFYLLLLGGAVYLVGRSFSAITILGTVERRYVSHHTRWQYKFLVAIGILAV